MSVLTIGGVRPSDIGLKVLRDSDRPILPATRDRMIDIPGRNGAWDFGADMEPRYFSLDCAFMTRGPTELQQHIERLARLLVDSFGKPRILDLVFSVNPERTYTVRYSGNLQVDRLVGLGRFTLPLVAVDPYAYGLENIYETTLNASPLTFAIQSSGDIRTEPVILLTNTGNNVIHGFTIVNEYQLE